MKSKKRKVIRISLILTLVLALIVTILLLNVNLSALSDLDEQSYVSFEDISDINEQGHFGKFVKADLDNAKIEVGQELPKIGKVVFKLFGFIPLKTVDVNILSDEKVYLGGNAVGFSIKTNGVIVVGKNSILTEDGLVDVCAGQDIREGDMLVRVDGKEIKDAMDIPDILNNLNQDQVQIDFKRKDKEMTIILQPKVDVVSGKNKIGLWVRDDATGIGTLTYVGCDNLEFGALGHPVTDGETGTKIDVQKGNIYNCSIVGIEKGQKGDPGELKGVFLSGKQAKGEIHSGSEFGIFGKVTDKNGVVDENITAMVGGRLAVKPGKAQIMSSVSGVREYYDIEIIKASKQNNAKDKSMFFRVTDKRLLNATGGIIQGMSGSPILQNGKLIGAVTHVFVSDPTKGYGIYIDWMMI